MAREKGMGSLQQEKIGERTLAATIRNLRLKEVRRQLRATKQPIRTIAANCGWANVNHLENAFKRRFGVSMRSCRLGESFKAPTAPDSTGV